MKIGFLGAGAMAEAILASLLRTGLCKPGDVLACDRDEARRALMNGRHGVRVTEDPDEAARRCAVLLLAVKPQDLDALLRALRPRLAARHLLISIAAGKTLAALKKAAGPRPRRIRVMPNLPLSVQEGMSVYCAAASAKPADRRLAARLFGSAGAVLELPERQFDAVTALSGSGPAFVAFAAQALIAGAQALGLPPDAARLLTEQTLIGTGVYLQNTGRDLDEFIRAVASPRGTTAAGLAVLRKSAVAATLARTLAAAAARSAELSRA